MTRPQPLRYDDIQRLSQSLRRGETEDPLGAGIPEADEPLAVAGDDRIRARLHDRCGNRSRRENSAFRHEFSWARPVLRFSGNLLSPAASKPQQRNIPWSSPDPNRRLLLRSTMPNWCGVPLGATPAPSGPSYSATTSGSTGLPEACCATAPKRKTPFRKPMFPPSRIWRAIGTKQALPPGLRALR